MLKQSSSPHRLVFLDNIRYLMILLVVVYHSMAAYANAAPHWTVHDQSFLAADIIREIFDVFLMPVLFFVAGYFVYPSLEKKGTWLFLKDKIRRLLIPWFLAVLIIPPLIFYSKNDMGVGSFWNYWLWYVGGFKTGLTAFQDGLQNHSVYWFISLLFMFFVLFTLINGVMRRFFPEAFSKARQWAAESKRHLTTFLIGTTTFISYFLILLVIPDASWLRLGIFLEFQIPRLVLFIGCFTLGLCAFLQNWFTDKKPSGSLIFWSITSLVLAILYVTSFRPLLSFLAETPNMPLGVVMAFSFIRSFLMFSLLAVIILTGQRLWNNSTILDRQLSGASYNIYLTHIWFVVPIQGVLLDWTGGSLVKCMIVFVTSLTLSFALSRWIIGRYPRAFVFVVMGAFAMSLVFRH